MKEGYKKTEVGVIPEDWEIVNINDVAERYSGHTPNKKIDSYWNGTIPWISLKDTKKLDNGEVYETEDYTTEDGINNSSAVLLPKGTIVLSRDATVGKVGIMSKGMATSQHFINYVCGPKLNNLYLYYDFFNKKEMFDRIGIGSTIKTIGLDFFKKLNIALPPLEEQEKIAEILSSVDGQIDDTEMLIEKCRVLKKGLMQRLLSKGIGHTEFKMSEIGEIPVSWEVIKFNNVIEFLTDYEANGSFTSIKENVNIYDEKNYAYFVRMTDLEKKNYNNNVKYVDKKSYDFLAKTCLYGGELLLSKRGEIGKVYLTPKLNIKMTLAPNLYLVKLDTEKVDNKYVYYYFSSSIGQKMLKMNSASTTLGALYKDDLKNIKFIMPGIEEQNKIAQILSIIDSEIEEYENNKKRLEELKKGLMQQLLTGKIRTK